MSGPSPITATFPKRENAPAHTSISLLVGARAPFAYNSTSPEVPRCYVVLRARPTRLLRPERSCGTRIGILSGLPRSEASRLPASAPAFSSHSPLATGHCAFDRYTCRTKNAASPSASSKLPNLIDTKSTPAASDRLHLGSSCPTAQVETLPISNLQLPPFRACYIALHADPTRIGILPALTQEGSGASRSEGSLPSPSEPCCVVLHACTPTQNLSAPLPRDFPRKSNPINKTAKISRHNFEYFHNPERSFID